MGSNADTETIFHLSSIIFSFIAGQNDACQARASVRQMVNEKFQMKNGKCFIVCWLKHPVALLTD